MIKADKTVINETKYIAYSLALLSIIMQSVFLILKRWNYTVLLGNLLTDAVMIANFFLMGLGIQKALQQNDENVKKIVKLSHSFRTLMIFAVVVIGVALPLFNTIAVIIPVFFPRIAILFKPLLQNKLEKSGE
ncbi:MAG: hypothetical protein IJE62_04335 [Clostridia bacterium]|nr:hypothetical protein [Clostridia bacterium]